MRRPYGFVTIKPCFAANGISAGFRGRVVRRGRDVTSMRSRSLQ